MSSHFFQNDCGHVFDDEFEEWLTERSGPWTSSEDFTGPSKETDAQFDGVDEEPQSGADA
jgi:hypothetical protein